jgi:predicted DNA-binding WGR domain protein
LLVPSNLPFSLVSKLPEALKMAPKRKAKAQPTQVVAPAKKSKVNDDSVKATNVSDDSAKGNKSSSASAKESKSKGDSAEESKSSGDTVAFKICDPNIVLLADPIRPARQPCLFLLIKARHIPLVGFSGDAAGYWIAHLSIGTHKVYVSDNGIVYDATLNQSNNQGNNNKFYRLQVLEDIRAGSFLTWTHWGRIGDRGQNKVLANGSSNPAAAIQEFEKKFKDKTGLKWEDRDEKGKLGKYILLHISYNESSGSKAPTSSPEGVKSEVPASILEPPVRQLLEFIFDEKILKQTLASLDYDSNKLPLGNLHPRTLKDGYEALKVCDFCLKQSQSSSF